MFTKIDYLRAESVGLHLLAFVDAASRGGINTREIGDEQRDVETARRGERRAASKY